MALMELDFFKVKRVFFLLFFSMCFSCFARQKMYELSACAVIKNEAKYIKEWIEFHRIVGVEHFYLYNNGSTDRIYKVLRPYIRQGIVTLVEWPERIKNVPEDQAYLWSLSTQVPAFENAIVYKAVNKTKWIVFLNIDEYLVPIESYNVLDLLRKYKDYPGIVLETDVFDASQVNLSQANPLVVNSKEFVKGPKPNIQKTFAKQIMKIEEYAGFIWPPYQPIFKDGKQPAVLKRSLVRVNCYVHRDKIPIESFKHTVYLDISKIGSDEMKDFLDRGYAIEDPERAISRYIPELIKKL